MLDLKALAIIGNYPEIPDGCRLVQLAAAEHAAQVLDDGPDIDTEELGRGPTASSTSADPLVWSERSVSTSMQ